MLLRAMQRPWNDQGMPPRKKPEHSTAVTAEVIALNRAIGQKIYDCAALTEAGSLPRFLEQHPELIGESTVNRWRKHGKPDPEMTAVAAYAHAFGYPSVLAFLEAAGWGPGALTEVAPPRRRRRLTI